MKDEEWYKHYDEARGIFFRIETTVACPKRNFFRYGGEVALEFSPALLKDHRDWIINRLRRFYELLALAEPAFFAAIAQLRRRVNLSH